MTTIHEPGPGVRRALLVANRNSRRGCDRFPEAARLLRGLGLDLVEALCAGKAETRSRPGRHRRDVGAIVIGGGDGTLNAAADALVGLDLPVGILPFGAANDLARTLGIPASLPEACRVVADGYTRRIDVGEVNGKRFFNAASIGLSAEIARGLSKGVKRRWGRLGYGPTAPGVLRRARPFPAVIRYGFTAVRVRTMQIAVGNGRHYGGGMTVAEEAGRSTTGSSTSTAWRWGGPGGSSGSFRRSARGRRAAGRRSWRWGRRRSRSGPGGRGPSTPTAS